MNTSEENAGQKLSIELAAVEDLEVLKNLLDQANDFSVHKSNELQWSRLQVAYDAIESHIERGEMYVARGRQGKVLGAVALTEADDIWNDSGSEEALYIHKLMRDHSVEDVETHALGARLLKFSAEEAIRRAKNTIRCDVMASTAGLVAYYERFGFIKKREARWATGKLAYLMEVPTAVLLDL